jgi:F-type H+-transporting ATPase subunit gamma
MANLKEVRERINSVMSTQQITKAMKMVAAAKLRRAQQAIVQMRPYANKLNEMLSNILTAVEGDVSVGFGVERPLNSALIVVVTSNRGLCGAFNTNVIKAALSLINGKYQQLAQSGNLTLLCIGKKGYDYFRRRYPKLHIINEYVELVGKEFSFQDSVPVAKRLMDDFEDGHYDEIQIAYGRFRNAALQDFITEQFLPVAKMEAEQGDLNANFIFEPDMDSLVNYLVPTILRTQLFKTILDSTASEHGARMTAMDKATENANDLLRDLRINYNKARQENITRELSEIVGGSAALEGN